MRRRKIPRSPEQIRRMRELCYCVTESAASGVVPPWMNQTLRDRLAGNLLGRHVGPRVRATGRTFPG